MEVTVDFGHSRFANGFNSIPLEFEGEDGVSQEIGTSGLGRLSLRNQSRQIPSTYMKTLGICWIVYGIFRLGMGVTAVLFFQTATFMFGALLARVANPFAWMDFFHILYAGCAILAFICGALGIFGGAALLRSPASGRGLLLAASLLSLSDLPIGIALSVYTLIFFLRSQPISLAADEPQPAIRQDIS